MATLRLLLLHTIFPMTTFLSKMNNSIIIGLEMCSVCGEISVLSSAKATIAPSVSHPVNSCLVGLSDIVATIENFVFWGLVVRFGSKYTVCHQSHQL